MHDRIRVLFLCHGNICRSPMAEFVMREAVRRAGLADRIETASAAVSREEIGNDMYPPARKKLTEKGVPFTKRAARQVTAQDLRDFDYVLIMDASNRTLLRRLCGADAEKARMLLPDRDVADPWYTGDFDATFDDVKQGCTALLAEIRGKYGI
ncbi:MAG: low molecular weight phosphotyrosine protein phosphatase [Clostridia bacterium]|nr:low molecular weight phosphotyrosine protein phosphatase [Clostridia bacterium]